LYGFYLLLIADLLGRLLVRPEAPYDSRNPGRHRIRKSFVRYVQAIKGISDATKINAAIIELQQHILSAQQALLDAQETINALTTQKSALESQLAKHSEWEVRRSQYQLTEVRPGFDSLCVFAASRVHYACSLGLPEMLRGGKDSDSSEAVALQSNIQVSRV